jgi:hypothetical protein
MRSELPSHYLTLAMRELERVALYGVSAKTAKVRVLLTKVHAKVRGLLQISLLKSPYF